MNALRIPRLHPRNPVAAPARARHAGAHGPQGGSRRQRERNELRQALAHLPPRHPDR